MTDKENILIELGNNGCNISRAIDACGLTLKKFETFMKDGKFQDAFKEAKQKADDQIRAALHKLVLSGDRQATIEANKFLRQSDDANQAKKIRKKVAASLIQLCDTKSQVLKEFCEAFECSKNTAEDYFKLVITEYGLLTPAERKKRERADEANRLYKQFEAGQLNEVLTLRGLYSQALKDSQESEYPSERARATEMALKIADRMDVIEEKRRREEEKDSTPLHLQVDAILFGSSPDHVERVNAAIEQHELLIESTE